MSSTGSQILIVTILVDQGVVLLTDKIQSSACITVLTVLTESEVSALHDPYPGPDPNTPPTPTTRTHRSWCVSVAQTSSQEGSKKSSMI